MTIVKCSARAGATSREVGERQAWQRLQVQALLGRVLAVTVAVGYMVAVATKTTLWPFAVLIVVVALTFAAGWWFYGEHGRGPRGGPGASQVRPDSRRE